MKRLHPPTFKSRDGSGTILQLHEDEAGKAPQAGGPPGVVAPGLLYVAANHCIAVDPGQRIGVILAAKVASTGSKVAAVGVALAAMRLAGG